MTRGNFERELNAVFQQNGNKRLYNDQFELIKQWLTSEYSLLSAERMRLLRSLPRPEGSPALARVEQSIEHNRSNIMQLLRTTVATP